MQERKKILQQAIAMQAWAEGLTKEAMRLRQMLEEGESAPSKKANALEKREALKARRYAQLRKSKIQNHNHAKRNRLSGA